MSLAELSFDAASGVATITLNRPEVLNALNVALAEALREVVVPLAGDARVRCVLLRGNGRAFMAGGDLGVIDANAVVAGLLELGLFIDQLIKCLLRQGFAARRRAAGCRLFF